MVSKPETNNFVRASGWYWVHCGHTPPPKKKKRKGASSLRKAVCTSTVYSVNHSSFSKELRAFGVGQIAGLEQRGLSNVEST